MISLRPLEPDLIIHEANIHTLSPVNPTARALAIKDGVIIAVGPDEAVLELAGDRTRLVDLGGRTVVPGLIDSHHHLLEVGLKLSMIRLDECASPEEMAQLVRERAASTPPGTWLVGQGWNEGNFADGRLPVLADIDAASRDHPVVLMRFFNTDLVNSKALELAGITAATPDPDGGRVERAADGRPNGLLRGAAKTMVRRLLPRPSVAEMRAALRLACDEALSFGITSVIEPGLYPAEIRAYQEARRHGELTVRVNLMPNWHGFRDEESEAQLDARAAELGAQSGLGDDWLRLGALKMAVDGGTSPHTAYMYEPYEGESEVTAMLRLPVEKLQRYLETAQRLGWDVGVHCCGDRAQDVTVRALAAAMAKVPRSDARHSIIHAYFPTAESLRLMAANRIAAVLQPTFLHWEGKLIFRDVGYDRAQNYKPARKYLDAGVPLASSSDVTSTVSADPFAAMYSLVTRANRQGDLIAPHEAITAGEALASYTMAGAWLSREEDRKGSLEPGKLADLVALSDDLLAVPPEKIRTIEAVLTMVGGRVLFDRLP